MRRMMIAAVALALAGMMILIIVEMLHAPRGLDECKAPVLDGHGNVITPGGERWPCSQDNPLL